ncbi:DUF1641 domain-containing protein [Saccharolobus caldissimus]|uniref:DUF1641 domain-containing protein n=1 Tax=Saccharolobus caldissimus TaxID=1702097 RepID=A0AAQ4CS04_9CREN|nr:DUF1641 domain-containing protein [Saccharolobus caldissimus]BDB98585.1 hypothetical protein SACC_16020 [Saccharolobus caldissimus]
MDERGVQAIDGLIEQIVESKDALEQFLRLLNALQKTGILPLLVGIVEKLDENLAFLAEQNAILIRNVNVIYSVLSGKEEVNNVSLGELIKELNDPDVKRGLYLILKILKAIGSASKKD